MPNYDHTVAKRYCSEKGLVWVEHLAADMDRAAAAYNFTQAQFDAGMKQHIRAVQYLFTPSSFPWKARIALAVHFLFGSAPKAKASGDVK